MVVLNNKRKKTSGISILKFVLVFLMGAGSGALLSNVKHQANISYYMRNAPVLLLRQYDSNVSKKMKDSLASFLPEVFAYPFFCRIRSIEPAIPVRGWAEGGAPQTFNAGDLIRPGIKFATSDQKLQLECRDVLISMSPQSRLRVSRHWGTQKHFDFEGKFLVKARKSAKMRFEIPSGELLLHLNQNDYLSYQTTVGQSLLTLYSGKVLLTWYPTILPDADSKRSLVDLRTTDQSRISIMRKTFEENEGIALTYNRRISLMQNGKFSKLASSKVLATSPQMFATETNTAVAKKVVPKKQATKINLAKPLITAKAGSGGKLKQLPLKWSSSQPGQFLPCLVHFGLDPRMRKVLKKYKSRAMSINLRGIKAATYYWKVVCLENKKRISSETGKIIVRK